MHPIHRFALVCFPSCASRFDGAVFCDQRMAVCFSPLGLGSVCFGALFFKKSRSFCNLCCLHLPHIHEKNEAYLLVLFARLELQTCMGSEYERVGLVIT
jgi:hypothetical protein